MLRQHSPAFYKLDECISALQKSIRRSLVREAAFWACQIANAGYANYLFKKLFATISTEDVGFGWKGAPGCVVSAYKLFLEQLRKSKTGIRNAMSQKCVRRLVVQTATSLAMAPKSRCVATASGWATSLPVTSVTEADACQDVDTWLAMTNQEFNLGHPCLLTGDLCDMYELKMGSPRQLVFFEALKKIWPEKGLDVAPGLWEGAELFLEEFVPSARWYTVPDFALDKHTERGRGVDTRERLAAYAGATNQPLPADVEKSHGPGVERKNQIAFFFDDAAKVHPEVFPDPFFERCREWYLEVAKQQGWKRAKTKFMIEGWLQKYKVALAKEFSQDADGAVLTSEELQRIQNWPHGQKRTAPHKKTVYMGEFRVWKGPYTPEAAKKIAERETFFALVGRTPFLGTVKGPGGVYLEMKSLVAIPSRHWKTEETKTKIENATVLERASAGIRTGRDVDEFTYELTAEMVVALCARAVTNTGDSHLGNLLIYADHVYNVDCEDTRTQYPDGDASWSDWLFSKKPSKAVVANMEKALRLDMEDFRRRLDTFERFTLGLEHWEPIKTALLRI